MIAAQPKKSRSRAEKARRMPSGTYLALIRRFPLRPIRSAAEYDAAVRVLDSLAVRPEGCLDRGEQDYFDTLTLLVENHDAQHFQLETKKVDGLSMLKYLMEQSGMKTSDLGRLLGNRGLASLIVNGHRSLSKAHMRVLADHFKVDTGLFLASCETSLHDYRNHKQRSPS